MNTIINKAQGYGLSFITKIAGSDLLDQLKIRKLVEKSLYQGSKTGFKALAKSHRLFHSNPNHQTQRLSNQSRDLFDLNPTEEQQLCIDMMASFAQEVLKPLAATADQQEKFPTILYQHAQDLGLNLYALPEALGGVANEKNIVTHLLIAEQLAMGDFSLAAGLLSTFSVINAITYWGNHDTQAGYLSNFADQPQLNASFAVQENTAGFNPYQLNTHAEQVGDYYFITGEKTLVLLAEYADLYLVSAMLNDHATVFVVEANEKIRIRTTPAMGLKAGETATLQFSRCPARLLSDQDFNYSEFLSLGNLMWCAIAVGTCQAVKAYCVDYANQRTAFGEPISHRQSVAFMIADMAIEIEAMRMLLLNAASLAETGHQFQREAYLARLLCSEKAMKIATDGVQVLGGHGFTKEHPVERWYRDLRATGILHSGLHA